MRINFIQTISLIRLTKIMNESPSKSKFDLFEEHDLSENVRHPLLSWDDYSPSWEQKFIAGVESMRTIPHVSLMRFSFIKVNFQDVGNANPTSGFSPATSISSSVSLNKTNESISTPRNSTTGQSDSEATTTTRTIESPNTSKRSEDMGNEPVRFKTSPSASSTTSRHMKRSLSKFLRPKRIKKRIDLLRSEPESSRTNHGSKGRNVDAPRSLPMLLNPNDSVYVALQLFRLNNPLYDYNEVQRKRRVKKMNQILDKDDGPFYINYR